VHDGRAALRRQTRLVVDLAESCRVYEIDRSRRLLKLAVFRALFISQRTLKFTLSLICSDFLRGDLRPAQARTAGGIASQIPMVNSAGYENTLMSVQTLFMSAVWNRLPPKSRQLSRSLILPLMLGRLAPIEVGR